MALGGSSAGDPHDIALVGHRAAREAAAAASPAPAATVIGIDDFARRRGHSYGTIVVDPERRTSSRIANATRSWLG